jgi:hypothetical protein
LGLRVGFAFLFQFFFYHCDGGIANHLVGEFFIVGG